MVLGYINLVLLYPVFLTTKEFGLYTLITSLAVMYSLVASLGIPNIVTKYFAYYRTEDGKHKGFMHWVVVALFIGFIATTLLYLGFKPVIIKSYVVKSPLFISYYYYLIPLAFFTVCFNLFEASGRAIYQTIFSSFLRDVFLRLLTTVAILLLAFKVIDFQGFIIAYVFINFLVSVMLLISLSLSKKFSTRLEKFNFSEINQKELLNYGLYTLISTAVYVLLQKLDVVMLSSMSGLSIQAVYSFYFNIAIVIGVPAQALSRTTYQIVTDSWKSKDMNSIKDVYYKTSIIQMVIGLLLFIGIIINQQNLAGIIHKKEYNAEFNLFIIIGLGFLIDITGGLNTAIIAASPKYRMVTGFIIISSSICIFLNYLLIPTYGGYGAALAYLITITILNIITWLYIKIRFQMQPFHYKHLLGIGIAIVCFVIGKYFWRMPNIYFDLVIRSGITTIIYILMSYYFHVSDDLNEKVDLTFTKMKAIIK